MTLFERWEEKVEKTGTCWLWCGAFHSGEFKYGLLYAGPGRTLRAHRFAYEHFVGPIPSGLFVRHLCHNPRCVNPDHLAIGTHADNMRDMMEAGRYGDRPWLRERGEAHFNAKLTDDDVRAIRGDPRLLRQIAAQYGISVGQASMIRTRKRRSEVADHATPGNRINA